MLEVGEPLALVQRAVGVLVHAEAVAFVGEPEAFVHVAVGEDPTAFAVQLPTQPEAFVEASVGPDLGAAAVFEVRDGVPLAFVDGVVLEEGQGSFLAVKVLVGLVVVVIEWVEVGVDLIDFLRSVLFDVGLNVG